MGTPALNALGLSHFHVKKRCKLRILETDSRKEKKRRPNVVYYFYENIVVQ
jgi:predicted RecB family nuclease